MDREILYRAKCPDSNEWVYGAYIPQWGEIATFDAEGQDCTIPVDGDTAGEYTGLKDRNGKRIFEGDIISIPWQNGVQFRVVRYKNGMFNAYTKTHNAFYCISLCSFVGFDDPENCCEVIGNIHDNPESMEEHK